MNYYKPEIKYTQQMVLELKKCMDDPIYFINNYILIYDSYKGKIKLNLLAYQEEMIRNCHDSRILLMETDREMGSTTVSLAYILWYSIFNSNKMSILMSHSYLYTLTFIRSLKQMHDDLPEWLRPSITRMCKDTIEFNNDCRICVRVAESNRLRGMTLSLVYIDGMRLLSNRIQEELYRNLLPVLSPHSKMIIGFSSEDCRYGDITDHISTYDNVTHLKLYSK